MRKPEPRDYQREALEWSLSKKKAIVCMPTGTGKTLVAALWMERLLKRRLARKILVLEPTRFLVEQATSVFKSLGLPASPVHGSLSRGLREAGWKAPIVVATPEIVVSEGLKCMENPDALVVDECHHTTGQDPYATVAKTYKPPWRLGLTAYLPPSRRRELEAYLGETRCWSWRDPRLSRYIPEWSSEVYEAPLNAGEALLYRSLEELWDKLHGAERVVVGNAMRWLARDGAEALRESFLKKKTLYRILESLESRIMDKSVRPAHKLDALHRILRDHEGFEKAIVFVDRVVIARIISSSLEEYNPVMLLGRRHINPKTALEKARKRESRIVIATSAGEEGIDLPEADLLVVWSNTASPLRFIQRLGRLLRPGGRGYKTAVFIATPDTVDMDSLIDGLIEAGRAGIDTGLSAEALERLLSLSRRRRILELVEEKPLPIDFIGRLLPAPTRRVEAAVKWLVDKGYLAYIFTAAGKAYGPSYAVHVFYKHYREYLDPEPGLVATVKAHLGSGAVETVRGSHSRVLARLNRVLERYGYISRINASIRVPYTGIERLVNASYSFPVTREELVRLVVDNAFSARKWLA